MTSVRHLLWTGGWDSTFRLLELLSRSNCEIQPHYIIDPERTSWQREVETMERLRSAVAQRWPERANRIRELSTTERRDIVSDESIDAAFDQIRVKEYIGQQYSWLARYAKMSGTGGIELCIESTDAAGRQVQDKVRSVRDSDAPLYEFAPQKSKDNDPVYELFQWFLFPLIGRDKKDMEKEIDRMDAWGLMANTWFCHQPVFAKYPCGTCRPCVYVVNKRQAWRIGLLGRLRFASIERPRRILPERLKRFLRKRLGEWAKRFVRA